jgi:hypothetical protein
MEADELIARIKERSNNPRFRNSMAGRAMSLYPPVDLESVREAERQMGFRLPPLLERIYVEIGNGGFGPGFGLYGVAGGYAEDLQGLTLPELYLSEIEYHWPEKLVSICDWGCTMGSAIDCSSPEGEIVFLGDSSPVCMPEGITFTAWLEDWVNGVDLFERVYRRYQKRDRPALRPPFDDF